MTRPRKIVLTGASGTLGRVLAPGLAGRCDELVLTDLTEFPDALPQNARFIRADLADAVVLEQVCENAGTIVHFGGINGERAFESILQGNIVGTYNVFEAARRNAARVIFASSNHVIGFYPRDTEIDIDTPTRPDSLYGVSKVFGEAVGRLYFDKHGVESVHLRIGSCLPEPTNVRTLSTWLSYRDLLAMVVTSIEAERTEFAVLWGVSGNARSWWVKDDAQCLGFKPQDDAEAYADRVTMDPVNAVADRFQGGQLCMIGYSRAETNSADRQ